MSNSAEVKRKTDELLRLLQVHSRLANQLKDRDSGWVRDYFQKSAPLLNEISRICLRIKDGEPLLSDRTVQSLQKGRNHLLQATLGPVSAPIHESLHVNRAALVERIQSLLESLGAPEEANPCEEMPSSLDPRISRFLDLITPWLGNILQELEPKLLASQVDSELLPLHIGSMNAVEAAHLSKGLRKVLQEVRGSRVQSEELEVLRQQIQADEKLLEESRLRLKKVQNELNELAAKGRQHEEALSSGTGPLLKQLKQNAKEMCRLDEEVNNLKSLLATRTEQVDHYKQEAQRAITLAKQGLAKEKQQSLLATESLKRKLLESQQARVSLEAELRELRTQLSTLEAEPIEAGIGSTPHKGQSADDSSSYGSSLNAGSTVKEPLESKGSVAGSNGSGQNLGSMQKVKGEPSESEKPLSATPRKRRVF